MKPDYCYVNSFLVESTYLANNNNRCYGGGEGWEANFGPPMLTQE